MKELAADESVSEEARESAKKAFEVLLSSQLLDIEQAAALKKIESEAQFANDQAQIQRSATMQKLEAEAHDEIKKLQAEAEFRRKKLEAVSQDLGEEMMEWLQRHRLQDFAAHVALIAGA